MMTKRGVFGLLFNPRLDLAGEQVCGVRSGFLTMLRALFVQLGLVSGEGPLPKLSFWNLMVAAARGVRLGADRASCVRLAVFVFVVLWMLMAAVSLLALGGGLLVSQAHADTLSILTSSPGSMDVARAWLNYMFGYGAVPGFFSRMTPGGLELMARQAFYVRVLAAGAMAALAVAGVLLLSRRIGVARTAARAAGSSGWSLMRGGALPVVFAFALLVPVSGKITVGQYLVVKAASVSSAVASNVWTLVLRQVGAYSPTLAAPPLPDAVQQTFDIVSMEACRADYNARMRCAGLPSEAEVRVLPTEPVLVDGALVNKSSYASSALSVRDVCGWFATRMPPLRGASTYQDEVFALGRGLAQGNFARAGQGIRQLMASEQGEKPSDKCKYDAAAGKDELPLIETVVLMAQGNGSELRSIIAANFPTNDAQMQQAIALIQPLGWGAAGTFLDAVDRMQENLTPVVRGGVPQTTAPDPGNMRKGAGKNAAQGALESISAKVADDMEKFHGLAQAALAEKFPCAEGLSSSKAASPVAEADAAARKNGVWAAREGSACGLDKDFPGAPSFAFAFPAKTDPFAQMAKLAQGSLKTAADLGGGRGQKAGSMAWVFFLCGLALAVLVPLLPFLRLLLCFAAWVAGVSGAVVLLPVYALARLNSEESLAPERNARGAFLYAVNLLLRPVLAVAGFALALLLFYAGVDVVNVVYNKAVAGGAEDAFFLRLSCLVVYTAVLCLAANKAFVLIDWVPSVVLKGVGKLAR